MRPRDVAIVGVYTTEQGRSLGRTTLELTHEALLGGVADAGLSVGDVDGYLGQSFPGGNGLGATPGNVAKQLGHGMAVVLPYLGAQGLLYAGAAIRSGLAETVALGTRLRPASRLDRGGGHRLHHPRVRVHHVDGIIHSGPVRAADAAPHVRIRHHT